ncbi:hypothetical protein [Natronoarchaeum rubrum]|uniref:hypothetical protein n=1 Tax=Natronoarchaeum rubrum TaxID=755311 RepID=UPI002112E0CE|nr:hypothetical protein [Natronoarchaeum rubrum]
MTDHDDVAQRAYHSPDPDRVEVRDVDDPEDGVMTIRMPISSTAEARDGKAFDRRRLEGWAEQIREGTVGAFLDHGRNPDVAGSRYSSTGKVGYLDEPELVERDDGETDLVVDNVLMDPETMPSATGGLREALARIKSQVERDIPLTASVGWSDDTGDRDLPGDSDLLENSLVGIPSDPSASSHDAAVAQARDVLADHDLDEEQAEQLVADFRAVVVGSDTRSDSSSMSNDDDPGGDAGTTDDEQSFSFERAVSENEPLGDVVERHGPDEFAESFRDWYRWLKRNNDDAEDPDRSADAEQFRDFMREQTEQQTEILRTLADSLREDDEDDDEDEEEEEEEESDDGEDDEDEDDEENSADADDERTVTIDGEEMTADEAVETLRDDVDGAEPETPGDDDDERDDEPADERTSDPKELL